MNGPTQAFVSLSSVYAHVQGEPVVPSRHSLGLVQIAGFKPPSSPFPALSPGEEGPIDLTSRSDKLLLLARHQLFYEEKGGACDVKNSAVERG